MDCEHFGDRLPTTGGQQRVNDGIEGGARAHSLRGQEGVGHVVAAEVHRPALGRDKLTQDLRLAGPQLAGHGPELQGQGGRTRLACEGLGPEQGQVEVRATVVELHDLALRGLAGVHELAHGVAQGHSEHLGLLVARLLAQVLQGLGHCEELAEGVPTQVAFLLELLHVLGRGAAGAGLEHATAREQRHDGQHLGAGAELQDGEQIREVVAQHVAGDRDGVLALAGAHEGLAHGLLRCQDANVQTSRVVLLQVLLDLRYHIAIVRTLLSEPEDGRRSAGLCPDDRKLDPILDRAVLRLAHAPNVTRCYIVAEDDFVGLAIHDAHTAILLDHEGLVMRSVLLSLRCHQANVGCVAASRRVQHAVLLAVLDDDIIDASIALVRDHELGVAQDVVLGPHLSRVADGRSHRGIHDDIGRSMEVRDSPPGVHISELRAFRVASHDVGLNLRLFRMPGNLRIDITQTVSEVNTELLEQRTVLLESTFVIHFHSSGEKNRIRNLHHRGLEVQRPKHVRIGGLQLLFVELPQLADSHDAGIDDLARQQGCLRLEHSRLATADQLDPHAANLLYHR
mmetsp:Transcript_151867/g.485387  ORF Transcript_151867/g.485387 Transcript_151867/m.485387 type:complete len:567 (-) Transcript_151867:1042-2742(-)